MQKMGRDIFYIYVFIAISLSCCSTHRKESGEERVCIHIEKESTNLVNNSPE